MHTLKYNNVFVSVIELWLIPHISVQTNKIQLKSNEWTLPGAGPSSLCSVSYVATHNFTKHGQTLPGQCGNISYFIFVLQMWKWQCKLWEHSAPEHQQTFQIVCTPLPSMEDDGISSAPETKRNLIFSPFLHNRHRRNRGILSPC